MDLLKIESKSANFKISLDDLITIHQALNEVCNGLYIFEFQIRLGVSREEAIMLMEEINHIINKIEEIAAE